MALKRLSSRGSIWQTARAQGRAASVASVLNDTLISYMSKSRSRLFTASRAPTSLWPSSSEAGWLRRSDADGTRPGRRPPPGNRSPELRAPACAKSFLGAGQRGVESVAVWAAEVAWTRPQDVFALETSSAATAALI